MSQTPFQPPPGQWSPGYSGNGGVGGGFVPAPGVARRFPGGELPSIGEVLNDAWQIFSRDLGPYAWAGFGQLVVLMPVVMVALIVIYGGMALVFVGAFMLQSASHAAAGAEGGASAVSWVAGLGVGTAMVVVLSLLTCVAALSRASLERAVARHQRGEGPLGFSSAYDTITQDLWKVIGVTLLTVVLVMAGVILCYLPGLCVALALSAALPLVVLFRQAPMAAVRESFSLVRGNLVFFIKVYGVTILVGMIAANIPVLGPAFMMALTVRLYRQLLGDGETPVMPPAPPR